jgi:hypothetical protein
LRSSFLVEMHRLRIELGGERQYFLARDVARAKAAEMAGREIFEGQRHLGIAGTKARLWPLFAAISTRALAWLVHNPRTPRFGAAPDLAGNAIRG